MLLPVDPTEPPPFTDDDLEAYFADEPPADVSEDDLPAYRQRIEVVAAWSVCDTGSAEWAMRMLAHAEAKLVELTADAERFHEQIDRWLAGEAKRPRQASNFFEGQLEAYARRRREEEGEKTLKLPSGAVTSRLNPARPEISKEAEEAFIAWAMTTPMVKTKWSVSLTEVKKRVTFERVRVPDYGGEELVLLRWPGADGESVWVAVPKTMADALPAVDASAVAAEDLPNFHDEVWPICEGQRVPGVVQVPAEVTYSVRPGLPSGS